ncbi:hypothetical protein C8J57DRAFT_1384039 [Mycena rebaudengoi]|nr:hypothetical protein C8J57DRAFT_1384039 [Mycena rebaudengoi]
MQGPGLLLQTPSRPVSSDSGYYSGLGSHKPRHSSPLAGSSPSSSPIAAAQARRRSQYKSRVPSLPVASSSRTSASSRPARLNSPLLFGDATEDPQKEFLRARLKQRCLERASRERARAVKKRRFMSSSEAGSDDASMEVDMDDEDEDDKEEGADPAFDVLFTRIMRNATRKRDHAYLYSYDREVGSSFDPALEESQNWELDLVKQPDDAMAAAAEEQALQAYLEEQAAFADFADIPADDLFSWSDEDEDLRPHANFIAADDMDISSA